MITIFKQKINAEDCRFHEKGPHQEDYHPWRRQKLGLIGHRLTPQFVKVLVKVVYLVVRTFCL